VRVFHLHHYKILWIYEKFQMFSLRSYFIVLKTNSSYQRWDEGRKNWGAIVNSSRTIMREGSAWIHESKVPREEKRRLICRLASAVWSFPRSMTRHLLSPTEDEAAYVADCRSNLQSGFAEDLIAAQHRPSRALYELSCVINAIPISTWRRINVDKAANVLCDAMGSNELIFTLPVPRAYTIYTERFLAVWLLFLPLTLYDAFADTWNHWAMYAFLWSISKYICFCVHLTKSFPCIRVPVTVVITFFLTGIEEFGLQLEEPFSVL
jgi:ion channel-forming bestrophin family protein